MLDHNLSSSSKRKSLQSGITMYHIARAFHNALVCNVAYFAKRVNGYRTSGHNSKTNNRSVRPI